MKYLILIILIIWILQRFGRIFNVVSQPQNEDPSQKRKQASQTKTSSTKKKIIPDDEGEYIDYEEVE